MDLARIEAMQGFSIRTNVVIFINPIVVGLFDSPILVGGQKRSPRLNPDW